MNETLNDSMKLYLEGLREEYKLYQQFFLHAREERKALGDLKMETLTSILTKKQEVLDRVALVENRIAHFRSVWIEAKDLITQELSVEIQSFLENFSKFMKELVDFEGENELLFAKQNELKEKELGLARKARTANRAYQQPSIEKSSGKTNIIG